MSLGGEGSYEFDLMIEGRTRGDAERDSRAQLCEEYGAYVLESSASRCLLFEEELAEWTARVIEEARRVT